MSVTENSVDTLWLLPSIFATIPPSFRHLPLPVFYHIHQNMKDCITKPDCKHAVNTSHAHRTWQNTYNLAKKGAENRRRKTVQLLPQIFCQASAKLPQKRVRNHHRQLLMSHHGNPHRQPDTETIEPQGSFGYCRLFGRHISYTPTYTQYIAS